MGRFGGRSLFQDDRVCFACLVQWIDMCILCLPLLLLELYAYSPMYDVFLSLVCVPFFIRVIHLLAPNFWFLGRWLAILGHLGVPSSQVGRAVQYGVEEIGDRVILQGP